MTCHPEVHDAAISQFSDYENEKRTEEYIVSLQDIASPDLTSVIVDEGSPTLLRRARVTGVLNVALYCVHIPAHAGHRFSYMLDTDSAAYWTPIPVHGGQQGEQLRRA